MAGRNRNRTLGAGRHGLTRREVLVAGSAVLAAPAVIVPGRALGAESIVFVSYGGSTQAAQQKAIITPFEKETGIKVISASGPDLAKLKAQVTTGNIEWDVMNFIGSQAISAANHGFFEKLDYSVIDASDMFLKHYEATIPWYVYGGGIGYDPKRTPKPPRDWKQFWDVKAFPGRRGLRNRPDENLEMALMADGVSAKHIYPIDMDRAFKSLDRIKPHIAKWIPATPQTISLIQNNEVDFDFTYSGRVESAKKQGISVEFVYHAEIVSPTFMGVVKGTRHKAAAMKLVSYFLRPDLQAAFCNIMGYAPVKRAAMKLLTSETMAQQPHLDDPSTCITDVTWWAEHAPEADRRFSEWLIS
jgi:putative spermidine/putrescine transport system substrate-binding protein